LNTWGGMSDEEAYLEDPEDGGLDADVSLAPNENADTHPP
jgi:hypothetical protein